MWSTTIHKGYASPVLLSSRVPGLLCNRRMKVKIKVYRTVVRPALVYGAETWALTKAQGNEFDVAEMGVSRTSGV